MGLGMSGKREYQIVYRELHQIQRELAAKGVLTEYKNRVLTGFKGSDVFQVRYRRINASNGESAMWPIAELNIDGEWRYFNAAPWMPGLSWKTAEPIIIEHFAA